LLVGVALLAGAVAACAPATSSPAPGQPPAPQQTGPADASTQVRAPELAKMLQTAQTPQAKGFLLVNVHVPYQGEIEGTDLFLPYDQLETNVDKLPTDKSTKIVLYCRSGAMSAIAQRTLVKLGYTNVSDLAGGMGAWQDAGYSLVDKAR